MWYHPMLIHRLVPIFRSRECFNKAFFFHSHFRFKCCSGIMLLSVNFRVFYHTATQKKGKKSSWETFMSMKLFEKKLLNLLHDAWFWINLITIYWYMCKKFMSFKTIFTSFIIIISQYMSMQEKLYFF